jgi:SagB-type dehydrogenase family enzyme
MIKLPKPEFFGKLSLEECLYKRCSWRDYKKESLTLKEISQILWAATGKNKYGKRTSPSAGATYPVVTYLVSGEIENLSPGLYQYQVESHTLLEKIKTDLRKQLTSACLFQSMVEDAPASLVLAAIYERTTSYYGERGIRYVHIEIGHIGENVHLQVEALGLGCVMIGAFKDKEVKKILQLKEEPLYIIPIGRK